MSLHDLIDKNELHQKQRGMVATASYEMDAFFWGSLKNALRSGVGLPSGRNAFYLNRVKKLQEFRNNANNPTI